MALLTMRSFLSDRLIALLKRIGKYDWLRFERDEHAAINYSRIHLPDEEMRLYTAYQNALIAAHHIKNADQVTLNIVHDFVMSQCLAYGPKMLRPTVEQCEALTRVDVNISFDDYQQPFPTVMVEFPDEFRNNLSQAYDYECPIAVVTHHNADTKRIISVALRKQGMHGAVHLMSNVRDRIEDALREKIEHGDDMDQAEVVQRIAVNFGLLMTYYGVSDAGPVNPDHDNLLRLARKKNKDKAKRAQRLLAGEIRRIEFAQEVVARTSHGHHVDYAPGNGTKCTHWRRGHFRNQPSGVGRMMKRLVFIKPILINSVRFDGDIADTTYSLTTQQRGGT
jgi:hypothetical protein